MAIAAPDAIRISGPAIESSAHPDCRRPRWRCDDVAKIGAAPSCLQKKIMCSPERLQAALDGVLRVFSALHVARLWEAMALTVASVFLMR